MPTYYICAYKAGVDPTPRVYFRADSMSDVHWYLAMLLHHRMNDDWQPDTPDKAPEAVQSLLDRIEPWVQFYLTLKTMGISFEDYMRPDNVSDLDYRNEAWDACANEYEVDNPPEIDYSEYLTDDAVRIVLGHANVDVVTRDILSDYPQSLTIKYFSGVCWTAYRFESGHVDAVCVPCALHGM